MTIPLLDALHGRVLLAIVVLVLIAIAAVAFATAQRSKESYARIEAARAAAAAPVAGAAPWEEFRKPSEAELHTRLTPEQYAVTQEEGTEPPFRNAYHDSKEEGIYVDIVSGEPLFSSLDKYDSGTGWPSFTKPLAPENIVLEEDATLFTPRTEVRSRIADSHLGHVFPDGPADRGGLRYCMNSAAFRFVPRAELAAQGYGEFEALFAKP